MVGLFGPMEDIVTETIRCLTVENMKQCNTSDHVLLVFVMSLHRVHTRRGFPKHALDLQSGRVGANWPEVNAPFQGPQAPEGSQRRHSSSPGKGLGKVFHQGLPSPPPLGTLDFLHPFMRLPSSSTPYKHCNNPLLRDISAFALPTTRSIVSNGHRYERFSLRSGQSLTQLSTAAATRYCKSRPPYPSPTNQANMRLTEQSTLATTWQACTGTPRCPNAHACPGNHQSAIAEILHWLWTTS